ncbi:MAG: hypothetical protein PWP31_1678 [Clostridia bacterium]|nr:hypothetical protein [Clostridia bacterium]
MGYLANLNELNIAQLNEEQLTRLREAERAINSQGNNNVFLMALNKKTD